MRSLHHEACRPREDSAHAAERSELLRKLRLSEADRSSTESWLTRQMHEIETAKTAENGMLRERLDKLIVKLGGVGKASARARALAHSSSPQQLEQYMNKMHPQARRR